MRIIATPKLIAFAVRYPDAKVQLDAWRAEARHARWKTPEDIKEQCRGANILEEGRVVFNILGNKYRLIVKFNYEKGIGFVRFLGTREEYGQINAKEV